MPHQCTDCDRTFADGSKEMLSGCPDCGNNQFQYIPKTEADPPEESPPERPGEGGVGGAVNKATSTVREWVNSGSNAESDDDRARSGWSDVASDVASEGREDPAARTSSPPPETAPSGLGSDDEGGATRDGPASPDRAGDDERGYGEWPNPDDADTSGVGKGPGVRRGPAEEGEDSPAEADRSRTGTHADDQGPTTVEDDGTRATIELDEEDTAQADARSAVVSPDEIEQGADDAAGPDAPSADDAPAPGTGPGTESAAPGTEASAPGTEASAPGTEASAPGTEASAPGTEASAPGTEASAPGTEPSAPVNDPPESGAPEAEDGRVAGEPTAEERPDLAQLREELNDQFESIKIVSPGTYELNLMELYDRNEYIISLQEDGRYVIEVPEAWRDDEE